MKIELPYDPVIPLLGTYRPPLFFKPGFSFRPGRDSERQMCASKIELPPSVDFLEHACLTGVPFLALTSILRMQVLKAACWLNTTCWGYAGSP